jgi:ferric-dicitrate binding protein FerR (iron transport regulator)
MSQPERPPLELTEWIIRSLDGRISPEEFAKLDHELRTSEEALQYYLELMVVSAGLVDRVGVLPKSLEGIGGALPDETSQALHPAAAEARTRRGPIPLSPDMSEEERRRRIERYAQEQLESFLQQERDQHPRDSYRAETWDIWDAVQMAGSAVSAVIRTGVKAAKATAICLIVAVLVFIGYLIVRGDQTVATLVSTVDARWADPLEEGVALNPQPLQLQQGYAQIRLSKGTEIIVQAPAAFELRTGNKVFLQRGLITAKVPDNARGFRVDTPGASVVDYGTEFGVLADGSRHSEIHVFAGRVEAGLNSRDGSRPAALLEQGQAAWVDGANPITCGLVKDRPQLFARTLPDDLGFAVPGRRLSLADLVGGGNGFNTGVVGQGVNPISGAVHLPNGPQADANNKTRETARFTSVPGLPYIDGVFVADGRSEPPVITSTGVAFEGCPGTSGRCAGGIVNGALFRFGSAEPHYGVLAGRLYGDRDSPSLGVPPNAGITFDLDKIRASMPGVKIEAFQSICGLSSTIQNYEQARQAASALAVTFWVLVDGNIRVSEQLQAVPLTAKWIDVSLGDEDRFLTLAVTSARESSYAWSLFGEPALTLAPK